MLDTHQDVESGSASLANLGWLIDLLTSVDLSATQYINNIEFVVISHSWLFQFLCMLETKNSTYCLCNLNNKLLRFQTPLKLTCLLGHCLCGFVWKSVTSIWCPTLFFLAIDLTHIWTFVGRFTNLSHCSMCLF